MRQPYLYFLLIFFSLSIDAAYFQANTSYQVCFTPGQNCTQQIVDAINDAKINIWVQSYSFTSRPIMWALVEAKRRGVSVRVIVDKSVLKSRPNNAQYLVKHQIPVWVDNKPAIAHNKVMVIDKAQVITGSFNFTRAAQERNAENLLIINDHVLAEQYLNNWYRRERVSQTYSGSSATSENNWLDDMLEQLQRWLGHYLRKLAY